MRDRKFFMQKNQWVAGRKVPSFLAMACFFLTILCPSILKAVENQLPQLKIANAFLGTRYDSDQQRTAFDAHEKIFLYIDIIGPVIQPAELTVNWVTPSGRIERYHSQTIQPSGKSTSVYYSWLKLMKKGKLSRTFSNQDYDSSYDGQWRVFIFLDHLEQQQLEFDLIFR
jgi:hypothetical protein